MSYVRIPSRRTRAIAVTALLVCAALAGCNYDEQKTPPPQAPPPATGEGEARGSEPTAERVAFAAVRREVLEPSCVKCHSSSRAAGGVNLETFEAVTTGKNRGGDLLVVVGCATESRIVQVIDEGSMPKGNGPEVTPEGRDLLARWIDEGATETGSEGAPSGCEDAPRG